MECPQYPQIQHGVVHNQEYSETQLYTRSHPETAKQKRWISLGLRVLWCSWGKFRFLSFGQFRWHPFNPTYEKRIAKIDAYGPINIKHLP